MRIAVRPVVSADAQELADLINPIIAAGGTTAIEDPFSAEILDQEYLTGPNVRFCFVAFDEESGRLEGFQTLIHNDSLPQGTGDIATFARIDGKQRGVGSALFAATSKEAARRGLKQLNATIRADNSEGIAFYSKMGFADHSVTEAVPLKDGTLVDRVHKRFEVAGTSNADLVLDNKESVA